MSQIELQIERRMQPDRNAHQGGRSFYFFDLDDNVFTLTSPIYIFHQETGQELPLPTGLFAQIHSQIGRPGEFENYEIRFDDESGSYRRFRDWSKPRLVECELGSQPFVEDIRQAMTKPDFEWKGPSWDFFFHAVFNQRPISIITARGHHPETIKEGISVLVEKGHLPWEPHYLDVFPVSHGEVRATLGDHERVVSVAELKKRAIKRSVEKAFEQFGDSPFHRFGMSDDDPHNIAGIQSAMEDLKRKYRENSFFVIASSRDRIEKKEVLVAGLPYENKLDRDGQLHFFNN